MRSRVLALVPAAVLLTSLAACSDDDGGSARDDTTSESPSPSASDSPAAADGPCEYVPDGSETTVDQPPSTPATEGEVPAKVSTSIGDLDITLDASRAPCTVNSFLSLAEQGYFDGTSCHRMTVSEGFRVLQCGDPTGTGSGGPGYSFADELDGTETYPAGTLAMANAGPDTNGSQFFIVYGDTGLGPDYTVFGRVDPAGLKAIDAAARAGVEPLNGPEDGTPKIPVTIQGVVTG